MKKYQILSKSYGSIPHLSISKLYDQADKKIDLNSERILTEKKRNKNETVIVTEKVDGSNVSIYKEDNKLYALSRSGFLVSNSLFKHLRLFQEFVNDNKLRFNDLLSNKERLCGEWMIKTMGLKYDIPHEPFIAFDIINSNYDQEFRLLYDEFKDRISNYNIISAGLVSKGDSISIQDAMNKLGKGFHGCLEQPEGIVYRLEDKNKVLILAKYVRDHKIDGQYMNDEFAYNTWK